MHGAPDRHSLKFALLTAACMIVLALYPQISLWLAPEDWHGAYAVTNYDEVAYSAYINNLVNGKPRTSDPFVATAANARDGANSDDINARLPESLFSIQWLPAYAIALPARALGMTTSTAFIWLLILSALFSALAVFALLQTLTGEALVATGGTLATLILGTPVAFQGVLPRLLNFVAACDFFPFLRRYQPGWAFPLFFVFCLCVWRAVTAESNKRTALHAAFAGLLFAALVFAYFYLWTAATAWLACFAGAWLIARRAEANRIWLTLAIIGAFALAAWLPYFWLLAQRSLNTDATQLLTRTHLPQPLAAPEIIAALLLAAFAFAVKRGRLTARTPLSLFTVSCLLTPFVLFNQQIVSGRVLQSFHYQLFIANYLVLLAGALLLFQILLNRQSEPRQKPLLLRRAFTYLALFAFAWGMVETRAAAGQDGTWLARLHDSALPAFAALATQEQADATREAIVFTPSLYVAAYLPTATNARPLWTPHSTAGGNLGAKENKRRFYLWLYYSGVDEQDLQTAIRRGDFEIRTTIFGAARALNSFGRVTPTLSDAEIIAMTTAEYAAFIRDFSVAQARNSQLDYLILPTEQVRNFIPLDRWYARGDGINCGAFTVYPLTLRTQALDKEQPSWQQ